MIRKVPINTQNLKVVMDVMGMISSRGFGNDEREKVEKIDGVWLSIFYGILSTFIRESGLI